MSKLTGGFRISIVDDDDLVRVALGRLMKAHGYLVETFESGAGLLNSGQLAHTDCLITDIQMPGMSGLELHTHLMAAGTPIPTILITAFPNNRDRMRALRAGIVCYLAKPFRETELLACIRAALDTGARWD